MTKATIYTKDYCPFCSKAKNLLDMKQLPYEEIDVTNDPAQQEHMVAQAGGKKTVPQIFFGDFHVGGCDELYELNNSGQLQEKFNQYLG